MSSLIPVSRTEQRAAGALRDSEAAASVVQPAADTARTVAENVAERAKEAAHEVGREAQSAVSSVSDNLSTDAVETPSGGTSGVPQLHG